MLSDSSIHALKAEKGKSKRKSDRDEADMQRKLTFREAAELWHQKHTHHYLGSALLNGQAASFIYHLLGIFHAMISLVRDPLVELTALVTRTAFASNPDEVSDLFPEASISAHTF